MPKFSGICSTDIFVIRAKTDISQRFLFYFLANPDFISVASRSDSGTKMPRADWKFLKNTAWPVPPLKEQEAMAEILGSLDEKVELLYRLNRTLEATAETVYRAMFQGSKAGSWPKSPLGELYDIALGRTPPRAEKKYFSPGPSGRAWVSIKDMGKKGLYISESSEYITDLAIKKCNIPLIDPDTVILSFKMTVGRVAITTAEITSNEAIAAFRKTFRSVIPNEYLYFFLKLFSYEVLGTTSTIATSLNTKMIREIRIPLPDKNLLDEFSGQCDPLLRKIKSNLAQISSLEKIRDVSLIRLLNGQIRVPAEPILRLGEIAEDEPLEPFRCPDLENARPELKNLVIPA
jgi:type I restriction enzyme S subunit